ncbi:Lrp/AsnC ligand binding domain-containing protein [Pseudooceanicola sp. CBS1P-1]|uniref:AsnC family transcriptional regulator n=1 Tax=Pseudooceanicola albus TaxID=2692189 RepID=A0A6L7G9B2_9RHOB|nr:MULTISPECIES: Lrp/AsnC family transcriptional regulator [Pseudooceanicola]MBT9385764.1 Lrp/AsnC ligand binding domain-containing protein [Pseudooceanicola endophyticus]MXN19996.1 AsnC family transcriptional regulator [Pseudooceanicola albus]
MKLDRIDRKIIAVLMADATVPLARLSHEVGLTQTPCWKRVRKLQEAGVIRARVALVDPEHLGLGLTAFAGVSAPDQGAEWHRRFAAVLEDIPEVMEAYRLTGSQDYVLRIVARDMADFERIRSGLTEAIPIRDLTTSFALQRLKSETALPVDTRTA